MSDTTTPELEAEAEAMRALAKSRDRSIRLEIARSSACPSDVLARFVRSRDRELIETACANPNLTQQDMRWVIRWRLLDGAANLVNNPSCPRQIADTLTYQLEQLLLLLATAPDQRSAARVAGDVRSRVRTPISDWRIRWWWGDPTTI